MEFDRAMPFGAPAKCQAALRQVAAALFAFALAACAASTLPAPSPRPDPQAVPRQAFLDMVKAIADAGLNDPDKIAALMHAKLVKKTRAFDVGQCPNRRAAQIDEYAPENGVWLITNPQDAEQTSRQWPASNGPLGNLKFLYHIERTERCSGTREIAPNVLARIEFQDVGGFCVLPNFHRPASTWNVDAFGPRPDGYRKENGVQVRFSTILGEQCFETVIISQGNEPYGYVF
jgi:hypothetical protein